MDIPQFGFSCFCDDSSRSRGAIYAFASQKNNEVAILKRDTFVSFKIGDNVESFFIDGVEKNPEELMYPDTIPFDYSQKLIAADGTPITCKRHAFCKRSAKTRICPICLSCDTYGTKCVYATKYSITFSLHFFSCDMLLFIRLFDFKC